MQSKLLRTLVGVGIALGSSGCFGQAATDNNPINEENESSSPRVDDDDDDIEPETDVESETNVKPKPEPVVDETPDPLLDAFCDVSWPPTKGSQDLPNPRCIDPLNECGDAALPYRCYALIAEDTCDFMQDRMDPLHCVDGLWECPPGSTSGWECEGDDCRNTCAGQATIPEAAGGAHSSE